MPTEISTALGINGLHSKGRPAEEKAAKPVEETRQVLPGSVRAEDNSGAPVEETNKPEQVDKIVEDLNSKVQVIRRELQFTVDDSVGYTVIKVLDSDTGEIIRQLPSEEVVALAEDLEGRAGGLVNARV